MSTRTGLLKYPGGKSYLADSIVYHLPPGHYTRYVEPFLGGGAVLLAYGTRPGVQRIGSDMYNGLITLWRFVSRQGELIWGCDENNRPYRTFLDAVQELKYNQKTFEVWRKMAPTCEFEDAIRTLVMHRFSRGGDGRSFAWSERLRGGKPGDVNAWENFVAALPGIAASVRDVTFEVRDVLDSIAQYDAPDTLWYMDPPYVHETRVSTALYTHEMTDAQHEALVARLRTLRGGCVVSGYRHPLYDSLHWPSVSYNVPCNQAQTAIKSRREEVLWIKEPTV